eukprot:scaffold12086_cov122-Isochrysis_galbana.AAC.4
MDRVQTGPQSPSRLMSWLRSFSTTLYESVNRNLNRTGMHIAMSMSKTTLPVRMAPMAENCAPDMSMPAPGEATIRARQE